TEHNVVGDRLWPTYAAKSIGLFLSVAAVLALMGGLLQINPVWLWGPFLPYTTSVPAQPDWYVGWVEGALRLFPPWRLEVGAFEIPEPFWPAVFVPGVTIALLYAWPFLEARFTGDRSEHHLLDRPRDHPVRTAMGVTTIAFYTVLFFGGGNDVMAARMGVSVEGVTRVLQVLVFALPALLGVVTYGWSRALREVSPPPYPSAEDAERASALGHPLRVEDRADTAEEDTRQEDPAPSRVRALAARFATALGLTALAAAARAAFRRGRTAGRRT
ncbi:MAG TPA: hypothetical protein VM618_06955, partial [Acidimicrobiia bacterium]|nr:hypothetical protein [Acidimicrobiia bacterium]